MDNLTGWRSGDGELVNASRRSRPRINANSPAGAIKVAAARHAILSRRTGAASAANPAILRASRTIFPYAGVANPISAITAPVSAAAIYSASTAAIRIIKASEPTASPILAISSKRPDWVRRSRNTHRRGGFAWTSTGPSVIVSYIRPITASVWAGLVAAFLDIAT